MALEKTILNSNIHFKSLPESTIHLADREDQATIEKTNGIATSYLIKVQIIIGEFLAKCNRVMERDRIQKEDQKLKYSGSNKIWGDLQREIGNRGFNFTLASLVLMAAQFALPQGDREIFNFFSNQGCRNLADMFNAETQSRQKQAEGISQLALAEINAMMNKGSSDASSKQEVINLLDKVFEALKRAAQTG